MTLVAISMVPAIEFETRAGIDLRHTDSAPPKLPTLGNRLTSSPGPAGVLRGKDTAMVAHLIELVIGSLYLAKFVYTVTGRV